MADFRQYIRLYRMFISNMIKACHICNFKTLDVVRKVLCHPSNKIKKEKQIGRNKRANS